MLVQDLIDFITLHTLAGTLDSIQRSEEDDADMYRVFYHEFNDGIKKGKVKTFLIDKE